jgi:hypothetical protein
MQHLAGVEALLLWFMTLSLAYVCFVDLSAWHHVSFWVEAALLCCFAYSAISSTRDWWKYRWSYRD